MKSIVRTAVLISVLSPVTHAAITVSSSSTLWSPVPGYSDAVGDHQTGKPSGDLVGSGTNYGFLVGLEDNGPESNTDGTLLFRLRLDDAGGNNNTPSYTGVAWVGIDADGNGSIDVFVGANFSGSVADIGIHAPGSGENISPSTTTIGSAYQTYAVGTDNYNYRPVDHVTDGGTTSDLSEASTGDTDYYLSFAVPLAAVVNYLNTQSIAITDQTPLRLLMATSTQPNALNQDIGGVTGAPDPDVPWDDGGGLNDPIPPGGDKVPEPSSSLLALVSMMAAVFRRRR